MFYKRCNRRFLALAVTICFLFSFLVPLLVPGKAMAADAATIYSAQDLATKAVKFISDRYQAGEKIDGYAAYVLTRAGENLGDEQKWTGGKQWTKDDKTLKGSLEKLADMLGNNNLLTYILATQNADGSFGPLGNDYGTKAPLQALALVKPDLPVNDAIYSQVQDSISRAVYFFQNRYQNGSLPYEVNGWNFDYRCVEALVNAGENLSVGGWVYNGKSLKDAIINSARAAASNPSGLDAVYLAKELTALHAVDSDSSYIDTLTTLANAIISKQNTSSNGAIYFGNSIYDDVMVLTALGKAGKLNGINQASALNYLNGFKHEHKNAWGQAAGAAWGGYYPEEPDLTAQVLTALSYFDGAKIEGSEVYKAIQEGLAYLEDIQDVDTGAIPARWDSTFATAETLIALKSLGKTYADYAGGGSPWVKSSRTKTIAQCLLALNSWNDTSRASKLVNLLKDRHSPRGFDNSVYSDMWAYIALGEAGQISVINEVYARDYILGKQSVAEATYGAWGESWGPDFMSTAQAIRALTYLPGYQQKDPQILGAIDKGLAYLKKWLQPDGSVCYTTDFWADDPVVDSAEAIITLKRLGQDPLSWRSTAGLSPVSYMILKALNEDGSFGAYRNVLDASEALYTYLILAGTIDPGTSLGLLVRPAAASLNPGGQQQFKAVQVYFNGAGSDVTNDAAWSVVDAGIASVSGSVYGLVTALQAGQTVVTATYNGLTATATLNVAAPATSAPERNYCTVNIAVVGMNGELLYGPGSVMVSKNNRWGLTALGALDATGLPYVDDNGFVKSIAGQANSGLNGWMYKVNGSVPMVGASQKTIQDGDEIIWWYSTDWSSPGPTWESLVKGSTSVTPAEATPASLQEQNKRLPGTLQASDAALEALEKIDRLLELKESAAQVGPLGEVAKAVVVVGSDKAMNRAEMAKLKKELAQNTIDLARKVAAAAGATITDSQEEIALAIPAGALTKDVEITVKKAAFSETPGSNGGSNAPAPPPAGYRPITAVYNFGPEGTTFAVPVTITLKFALPPLARAENLALAWYDKVKGEWVAIPAVVDVSKGLIVARVNHFSDFAVFVREARKSFADVTPASYGWAKDTIEELAGAGVVAGVDGSHFEPGRAVTRAEFASLLVKALGLEAQEDNKNPFKDIKGDAWYAGAVTAAAANGLVKGYEDGTFRPDRTITREEVAAMLVRAMNLPTGEVKPAFKDKDKISAWARNSVAAAAASGLVKGFEDGTFRPGAAASRAECAVMVYRMLVTE
ncbi:S-layer homology domain protein [Neomoorella glycerini]|uniref:S-layer homology domain protein n=1 Tax=Neomoorella glycerini TaxID=55779 RepID=A0A6I5ZWN3_9FIRM|nr:S-layer homology domain-containing protein [Moorella glycerini]QGP93867.1 S-layer homology domain protein [Moorella glycerini]